MDGKWLELSRGASSVSVFIYHPGAVPYLGLLRAAEAAATALDIQLIPLPVHDAVEITAAITRFASGPDGGLIAATHAVTFSNRNLLTAFGDVESGGLLSYGSDQAELFRGAATYVDLVLKGANPAELPASCRPGSI